MVAGVQVVVAATAAAVIAGQRHGGDQRFIDAPLDDVAEIVDVRHRAGDGAEQENPPVAVLVDEDVVEAARLVRCADAADLADRFRIGQSGDVEDHRAHVAVGATAAELHRLDDVVATVPLEVLDVHRAVAGVQILILDPPLVDHLGPSRVV